MAKAKRMKWRCQECGWMGAPAEALEAPNPFSDADGDTITGCPTCRQVDTMELLCDEEGCSNVSKCGSPTPNGYRQTCGDHHKIALAS
jgi:hypothetical protein